MSVAEGGRSRRVTVDDVAAHAQVSQSTVSQVLSGSRPVAEATRLRVLRSIEELGYRPNRLARALRQQRSHTVAIVVPNITHVLYPLVARGASEIFRPLGYQVALYDTDNHRATETQVLRAITERMVDGAILFGYPLDATDAEILNESGISIVNGGLDNETPAPWDTVRVAQADALRGLVESLGPRYDGPIAYIGGPAGHGTSPVREKGFRDGMAAIGRPAEPAAITAADSFSFAGGRDTLNRLLDTGPQPRLVVCANDLIAIGAMAAARDRGLGIPDDIAFSGYDNTDAAELAVPPLTTVEAFANEQGRACARLLLDRVTGTHAGPARHLTLSTQLVLRRSA